MKHERVSGHQHSNGQPAPQPPAIFEAGVRAGKANEVVDHIIPGALVFVLVMATIVLGARPPILLLCVGLVILLAGLWMSVTHLSLARQALSHEVTRVGAAYHCSTAVAMDLLGAAWGWTYRNAGA